MWGLLVNVLTKILLNRNNFILLLEYRIAAAISPEVKNHHTFPEECIQKKTVDSNFKVFKKYFFF